MKCMYLKQSIERILSENVIYFNSIRTCINLWSTQNIKRNVWRRKIKRRYNVRTRLSFFIHKPIFDSQCNGTIKKLMLEIWCTKSKEYFFDVIDTHLLSSVASSGERIAERKREKRERGENDTLNTILYKHDAHWSISNSKKILNYFIMVINVRARHELQPFAMGLMYFVDSTTLQFIMHALQWATEKKEYERPEKQIRIHKLRTWSQKSAFGQHQWRLSFHLHSLRHIWRGWFFFSSSVFLFTLQQSHASYLYANDGVLTNEITPRNNQCVRERTKKNRFSRNTETFRHQHGII